MEDHNYFSKFKNYDDFLFDCRLNDRTWEDAILYREDYIKVIKERESVRIKFSHRSPQLHYREFIVKYLKELAAICGLSHCTLHLAVYLMDIVMDHHLINVNRVRLVCNVCLLIAAKLEENNLKTPKIAELNAHGSYSFAVLDYKLVEIVILRFFRWTVMYPTAAHYSHYFIQAAINENDCRFADKSVAGLVRELHDVIRVYLDKILDDVHHMQYNKPSFLAAAIIAIARRECGLEGWTPQLTKFTSYTYLDIEETVLGLLETIPIKCLNC